MEVLGRLLVRTVDRVVAVCGGTGSLCCPPYASVIVTLPRVPPQYELPIAKPAHALYRRPVRGILQGRSPRSTLRRVRFRRYRRGALILTTNRAPADLYPLFPNPVLAEGLLDRLLNSAYVVTMRGRSYRPRQRPGAGWSINLINTRPTWIADAITP